HIAGLAGSHGILVLASAPQQAAVEASKGRAVVTDGVVRTVCHTLEDIQGVRAVGVVPYVQVEHIALGVGQFTQTYGTEVAVQADEGIAASKRALTVGGSAGAVD